MQELIPNRGFLIDAGLIVGSTSGSSGIISRLWIRRERIEEAAANQEIIPAIV